MSTGTIDRARNRSRIAILILLATLNYCIAAMIGAAMTGVAVVVWVVGNGGTPDSWDGVKFLAIGAAVVIAVAAVIGAVVAVFRLPTLRRGLERRVLAESGAVVVDPDVQPRVRNLLDGLAIAAGIDAPRFAIVEDPAPNSFGVGTHPDHTLIAVTTGLIDTLTRDELEAVLAYEITRVASLDVAMASWTAAITGSALAAVAEDTTGLLGRPSRALAQRLQIWALRGQGRERDEQAVRTARNPAALIRALEALSANPATVCRISVATAPLWIEVPEALAGRPGGAALGPLLLTERIAHLRELAHLPAPDTAPS